jgi:hypothetical protein
MKENTIKVRVSDGDHGILAAAARQTHGGKVAPYVHAKAMEAARRELALPPVAVETKEQT